MTVKRQYNWVCDSTPCGEVSKNFDDEYNGQPPGWAQVIIVKGSKTIHLCPKCVESLIEILKVEV
jgi:hypothetical protein